MILKARGLSKTFFQPEPLAVISSVDFDLAQGEKVAILGRSGEGKTTLLHLLGTLEEPTEGTLLIQGEKVTQRNAPRIRNQTLGFLFQDYNLLPDLTLLENLRLPSAIARMAPPSMELLAQVGLADRAHFPTRLLSGGEKQRGALARAIASSPAIVFADEPTGNLDSHNRTLVADLLFSLPSALVLVTHDERLAKRAGRVYHLDRGRLI
jgi:lipoprotein-releasing system ATP-binding protein